MFCSTPFLSNNICISFSFSMSDGTRLTVSNYILLEFCFVSSTFLDITFRISCLQLVLVKILDIYKKIFLTCILCPPLKHYHVSQQNKMLHTTNVNSKYTNTNDNNIRDKNYKNVMKQLCKYLFRFAKKKQEGRVTFSQTLFDKLVGIFVSHEAE